MKKWIIGAKIIVFGAVAVLYFVFRGPELPYAIYIPLDFLLELVLLTYRVTEKYIIETERRRAKERELLVASLQENKEKQQEKDPSKIKLQSSQIER